MIESGQSDGAYLLNYGGLRVPFQIEYRERKNLAITVHPDQRLEIVAPEGCDPERVLERIERRQAWILKQWRYFEQFKPAQPVPSYVSGETSLYLGRQYRLKVHGSTAETVKLVGRFLHVWVREKADRDRSAPTCGRLVSRPCGTAFPGPDDHVARAIAVAQAGRFSQTYRPSNAEPLGKLHEGREHPAESRAGQDADSLHRLRNRPRAMPPSHPQSQPGLLPLAEPMPSRLG